MRVLFLAAALACVSLSARAQVQINLGPANTSGTYQIPGFGIFCGASSGSPVSATACGGSANPLYVQGSVTAEPPLTSPQGGAVVSTYDPNSFYSCAGAFSPTAISASAVPSSGGAGNLITIKNPAGSGKIDRLYTVAFSPQSTTATMVTVWYAFFSGAPSGGSPATVTPGAYDPVDSSAASAVCNTYAGTGQTDGTLLNLILDESGDTSLLTAAVGGPGTYALNQGGGPLVLHPGFYASVNLTGASLPSGIVVKYALYFSEGAQ